MIQQITMTRYFTTQFAFIYISGGRKLTKILLQMKTLAALLGAFSLFLTVPAMAVWNANVLHITLHITENSISAP